MKFPLLATTLFCAIAIPNCAYDDGKGPEDDALGSYEDNDAKADSFRNPTEHGELLFGVPQSAALTDDSGFHSWDFELSDDALVSLETLISPNLDTVMYLYKWNPDAMSYGRFKFKNDDANANTVASALVKSLDAGRYRVLVKGFKRSLRGSFDVSANCEGPGCAASSCDITTFDGLVASNGDSCGELFSAALATQSSGTTNTTVTLDERCSLPADVALAIESYVEYFGGLAVFEDNFNFGSPGDPVDIDVEWTLYENGTKLVGVDGGGDEAAMDYLINGEGQVIAHYQHNQSPDHTLYCDGGVEFLEDGECFFEYVESAPHAAADERTESATVTMATAQAQLERNSFLAVQAYVAELGLASDVDVKVEAVDWDSAARVEVKAAGEAAHVYELAAGTTTQFLFTVKRGSADKQYDCREL
jgi:hypothetical protein